MKNIAIFGAGAIGKAASHIFQSEGYTVHCFIDNDEKKWGKTISNVPVIGLQEYCQLKRGYSICICCTASHRKSIIEQLTHIGISDFFVFDECKIWASDKRERVLSYAHPGDMEDVILYHVLHDVSDIFYIDVGSNDPWSYSVTKLFYDKGAHGINIDPLPEMVDLCEADRPRDINLCVGCGAERNKTQLYIQGALTGGGSTTIASNCKEDGQRAIDVDIVPLQDICEEIIPIDTGGGIHFLKVDVEGAEKDVLLGADFTRYRPWIIVMESTLPNTDIPTYGEWEPILLQHQYHLAFNYGVNRYYVADEKKDLDERFLDPAELRGYYRIYHAEVMDWM